MDYNLQKTLHERSIAILELRKRAVKRLQEAYDRSDNYLKATRLQQISSFYPESHYAWGVKKWTRGVSFIEGMYERHMRKIRDATPWKSAMMLPGKGIMPANEEVPVIDYYLPKLLNLFNNRETGNTFVRDGEDISNMRLFLTPRLNDEMQRRAKEMFENQEKGLVEPVGVTYEERYSPDSQGYQ